MVHSTALNSSDNLHSYPPDNHHSSDDVYRRGGGVRSSVNLSLTCQLDDVPRRCLVVTSAVTDDYTHKHTRNILTTIFYVNLG